ncbi:hypothetical protein B0T10DRAFT_566282 [Thelonectria olida]|uniref:Extracellular membrane protein CFEM domain-containing protein n=1 Tax=Thelonectria olida TaxID=1576542 RepID=A0A9P9AGX5_9HYPO|nr:hypothetical protein B0T10DRAFT_566282 [Thelonectria olida]
MSIRYLLVSLAYLLQLAPADATQTIASLDEYELQRTCVTPCFWSGDPDDLDSTDILGRALQCCDGIPCRDVKDSCYCRPDLRVSASSFLSHCVEQRCQNEVDFSTALGIYDDYCGNKRDEAASEPANTEATATKESDDEPKATASQRDSGTQATSKATENESSGAVVHMSGAYLVLGFLTLVLLTN